MSSVPVVTHPGNNPTFTITGNYALFVKNYTTFSTFPRKRIPASLSPAIYNHPDQKLLYVSSENQNIPHCPFGPAHYFKSKPSWYINGNWLNAKEIRTCKEILSDNSIAPRFINHKVFRYPSQWCLENGPVLTYWNGEKYRPTLLKKVIFAIKTIQSLCQKLYK